MRTKITILTILIASLFSIETSFSQEKKNLLESFIQKKREHNKTSKTGFSILLYNGNENEALEVYKSFAKQFDYIKVKLTYISPDWKVITNPYSTKIEAEHILMVIKEHYPDAKVL